MPSSDDIRDISITDAILIHDAVFGYHDEYSNPSTWDKYTVIIGTHDGFIAGYVKNNRPHLSLAGVASSGRGRGLYGRLVRAFADKMGSDTFTISTYPDKFPIMARWIMHHLDVMSDPPVTTIDGKMSATVQVALDSTITPE